MRLPGAVVGAWLLLATGAAAQGRGTAAVAGAGVERLVAVVTDANGQLVRDLAQDDFVLLEDGRPQLITHFAFVGRSAAGPAPEAGAPARRQSSRSRVAARGATSSSWWTTCTSRAEA